MPTSNKSLFSSTENIKEIIAATRGTDDESNEVAVVPRSTSLAIKHEREDASIRFGNEVALMNEELENNEMKINENALEDKNAQKDIFIPNEPAKKVRTFESATYLVLVSLYRLTTSALFPITLLSHLLTEAH